MLICPLYLPIFKKKVIVHLLFDAQKKPRERLGFYTSCKRKKIQLLIVWRWFYDSYDQPRTNTYVALNVMTTVSISVRPFLLYAEEENTQTLLERWLEGTWRKQSIILNIMKKVETEEDSMKKKEKKKWTWTLVRWWVKEQKDLWERKKKTRHREEVHKYK